MDVEEATSERTSDRIEALYLRHVERALRFAYLLTGSRERAEDSVQEAFLRVFKRFGDLRSEDAFGPYLRRTILNIVRGEARKESSARKHPNRNIDHADPTGNLADRAAILDAMQLLPVRQRAAIVLRYYEDLSEEQSAEILRCSKSAVRSLVARASEALREKLGGFRDEI